MSDALRDLLDWIASVERDAPTFIMSYGEDEFIAVHEYDIPYAESEGYRVYGSVAELTA